MNEKVVDLCNYTKEQVSIWCEIFLSKLDVEVLSLNTLSVTLFNIECTKNVHKKTTVGKCAIWYDSNGGTVFELDTSVGLARLNTQSGFRYFLVDDVINHGLLQ